MCTGCGISFKGVYGYKIATYSLDRCSKADSIVEKFVADHLSKFGIQTRIMDDYDSDKTEVNFFDPTTNEWKSPSAGIVLEPYSRGNYELKLIANSHGIYNNYFIVLREITNDHQYLQDRQNDGTSLEIVSQDYLLHLRHKVANDMPTDQEKEDFQRYLHEKLGIPLEDIKEKCDLHMVLDDMYIKIDGKLKI